MRRELTLVFLLFSIVPAGFAQSGLSGKWATDRPSEVLTEAQRKDSVQLDVIVEDDKVSGTLAIGGLGGNFYTFKDGRVSGKRVQFQIDGFENTWTLELVDENTVRLSRPTNLPLVGNNLGDLLQILGEVPIRRSPPAPEPTNSPGGGRVLINGTVQDPVGASIPGATITARNSDNGVSATAFTDGRGSYSFSGLTPGTYTIAASLRGFQTANVDNFVIGDTQRRQNFTLVVSGAQAGQDPSACIPNGQVWCRVLHRKK